MKYGIVAYSNSINMGDEVQSLAAKRLLPSVDYYIDRSNINKRVSDEEISLICNGWFTGAPSNWPPAENIIPLFISFHVTNSNKSKKLIPSAKLKDYYSKFGPVGCRDLKTLELFRTAGIEAYYSGDLTLTLENEFSERTDDILLVDPLRHNYTAEYRNEIIKQIVPGKYSDAVKIVKQRRSNIDISNEDRFNDAEKLIEQYSRAKLVITSRIHCALPCLALGTPVYFINAGYHSTLLNLNDRFAGILEMFKVFGEDYFPYAGSSLADRGARIFSMYKGKNIRPLPIDWDNPEPNSYDFSTLKANLLATVGQFLK
ncbi:MAG: polysaccharide pyruvyl transferase family protein [Bacteroidales bacterium]|nr:polysaccharide pyruvyl transferase family protein [Bacteroidales bacterium]